MLILQIYLYFSFILYKNRKLICSFIGSHLLLKILRLFLLNIKILKSITYTKIFWSRCQQDLRPINCTYQFSKNNIFYTNKLFKKYILLFSWLANTHSFTKSHYRNFILFPFHRLSLTSWTRVTGGAGLGYLGFFFHRFLVLLFIHLFFFFFFFNLRTRYMPEIFRNCTLYSVE